MRVLVKVLKHPVYWVRVCLAFPLLFLGFGIDRVCDRLVKFSIKLQDFACAIEGDVPDDDDYEAPVPTPVRKSGQAVSESVVVPELSGSALREDADFLEGRINIVLWTDEIAPGITKLGEDSIWFYDYESLWHFKPRDRIQYATKVGTTMYEIIRVEPANHPDFPKDLRKVTARRMVWKPSDPTKS